ncbi:flagellar hook-basal body complex protein FliE [Thermovibrio sp.]
MRIEGLNSLPFTPVNGREEGRGESSFEAVLKDFLKEVNSQQLKAGEVEKALAEGRVKSFEEALFTVEKAELSLRLLVELRNKALESYQEIMRMQV